MFYVMNRNDVKVDVYVWAEFNRVVCPFLFWFKQKTAYEMRISDWSSDVCSSDLWSSSTALPSPRRASSAIRAATPPPCCWAWRRCSNGAPRWSIRRPSSPTASPACRGPAARIKSARCFPRGRKSVGKGKSVYVRVDLGGRRLIKKKYTESDSTS